MAGAWLFFIGCNKKSKLNDYSCLDRLSYKSDNITQKITFPFI